MLAMWASSSSSGTMLLLASGGHEGHGAQLSALEGNEGPVLSVSLVLPQVRLQGVNQAPSCSSEHGRIQPRV
jgi:hypothetical protein